MTNKSILDGWEEEFKTKFASELCASCKEVWESDYACIHVWPGAIESFISSLLQAQREKDKERLLEGVRKMTIYPEPMAEGSDVDDAMIAYNKTLENIEQLINKIYES